MSAERMKQVAIIILAGLVLFLAVHGDEQAGSDDSTLSQGSRGQYTPLEDVTAGPERPVRLYIEALYQKRDYATAYAQLEPGLRNETDFDAWKQELEAIRRMSHAGSQQWFFLDSIQNATYTDNPDYAEFRGATVKVSVRKVWTTAEGERQGNTSEIRMIERVSAVEGPTGTWFLAETFNPFY